MAEQLPVDARPHSLLAGDALAVSIGTKFGTLPVSAAGIQIYELGDAETSWVATPARVRLRRRQGRARAAFAGTEGLQAGRIFEIRDIELYSKLNDEKPLLVLRGGRDFPRLFFEARAANAPKRTRAGLRLDAFQIEERRRIELSKPLGSEPGSPNSREFRVLAFIERCLVTRPLRLEGCEIVPIGRGNGSMDEANLINRVLLEMGWPASMDPVAWAERTAKERPVLVIQYPRIFAESKEHAVGVAISLRDKVLDLLALHRGARGSPIALFVAEAGTDDLAAVSEQATYTGNLLGGFLSGENPAELMAHARVASSDNLLSLFLSLHKDALSEREPDFAYLRYWGLLEVMASARVSTGIAVTDFTGAALFEGPDTATTSRARGRIYELIKTRFQTAQLSENFLGPDPLGNLWAMTGVWFGYRNAAGHYGGFRPGDPLQTGRWWHGVLQAAQQHCEAVDRIGLNSPYLLCLRRATEFMLRWELNTAGLP